MGATGPPQELVRPAGSAEDREAAAEALALAFVDDPCLSHLVRDRATRGERLLTYFSTEIETLVPDHREVWVSADGSAAAVGARPGRWRVPFRQTLAEAKPMASVFGRRLRLALRASLRLERHHPSERHWYLHYLGVEPGRQGRGLGGALLAPVLELCDRERLPAYLEASSPRNAVLYERHGFS